MARWWLVIVVVAALAGLPAAASAQPFSVKTLHFDVVVGPSNERHCDVIGDLYRPASATAAHPAPAVLTTNGFGGSKNDQADLARALAADGYVVLSYSGLGFGGSGCQIQLDDRDWDGKAASQLVTFLGGGKPATDGTTVDYVIRDQVGHDGRNHAADPRVGMIGGSYGGQVQFAAAGIDPRIDTIVPVITWNDLAYSLTPNNTAFTNGVTSAVPGAEKVEWVTLFFAAGQVDGLMHLSNDATGQFSTCPNFDPRLCLPLLPAFASSTLDDTTAAVLRHASVQSFIGQIRIPTLLMQGEADTLFNLQESLATYRGLRAQGTPVKLVWQSWGHSHSAAAPGELSMKDPASTYEGRTVVEWMNHYLKDDPAAPSLDFTFFRPWVSYTGSAAPAYGRAPAYPVASNQDLYLSGGDALVAARQSVTAGSARFLTSAGGLPTSYTETSAADQSLPLFDLPGTFGRFESAPLVRDTDVVGVPSVDLRIDAPVQALAGQLGTPGELVLFFKLYDVAPDGTATLPDRLISPARFPITAGPVHVELPGIVHRFPAGHRMALVVTAGDAAYRGNNVAAPVSITTDPSEPGVVHLPVAQETSYGPVVFATAPRPATSRVGCTSRRSIVLHVRRRYRGQLVGGQVLVGKRRFGVLRSGSSAIRVNLSGRPAGRVAVTLVMRLRDGRRVSDVRRFRLCA